MKKRTGLRKPMHHLKLWSDESFSRRVTPRLKVGMVDEWIAVGQEGGRKSWYLSLTQDPDLAQALGPIEGIPKKGKTLLLFEDDVVALVQHLLDSELVQLDFDSNRALNGPARDWEETTPLPVPKLQKRAKQAKQRKRKA